MTPTNRSILNDNKVDSLSTKNNNMKMRRVTNAAAAINPNDYVIKSQVDNINNTLTSQVNSALSGNVKLNRLVKNLLNYGTHAQRLALSVSGMPDAAICFETDRSNVAYEIQNGAWAYCCGEMYAPIASRPTDLGVGDTGFLFRANDTNQLYKWSGTAWVLEVWVPTIQTAAATSNLILTTSTQAIPGTSLILSQNGTYLIMGIFYFIMGSGDLGDFLTGNMNPAQATSTVVAIGGISAGTEYLMASQNWGIKVTSSPITINLVAYKSGGTGNSQAGYPHTTITALWVSP